MITEQSYLHGPACARARCHMGVSVYLRDPTGAQNLGEAGTPPPQSFCFPYVCLTIRGSARVRVSTADLCVHQPLYFLGGHVALFVSRMWGTSLRDWEPAISTGVFTPA